MLMNPDIVFDLLSKERAIREFQVRIRKSAPEDADSMDEMIIRLEAEGFRARGSALPCRSG